MLMGVKEIQEIIPHRHPFLLIDCIEELEPVLQAEAVWATLRSVTVTTAIRQI